MKPFVLGIAGYMGSGKSTVAAYFATKGAKVIDADVVVDTLYEPNHDGYLKIANFFGAEYLTSKKLLNRKKLANFVFKDLKKLKILNYLIHPLVASEVQKLIDKAQEKFMVVEAIYFEEKHLGRLVDAIVWVECEEALLEQRALQRPGMNVALFKRILKAQTKPEHIDYVVNNNGDLAHLYRQLDAICDFLPIAL